MCPLAVGAQLIQRGWVRRALALQRENASHIAEQRHHLGQNRRWLSAYIYLRGSDHLGAEGQKGHEKCK